MSSSSNIEMPFGKYKGEELGNIPASYLLWFVEQPFAIKYPQVCQYVEEHRKWLLTEAVEEKWKTR